MAVKIKVFNGHWAQIMAGEEGDFVRHEGENVPLDEFVAIRYEDPGCPFPVGWDAYLSTGFDSSILLKWDEEEDRVFLATAIAV